MRCVIVFLRDTTEVAAAAYLDAAYPEQREPWVEFVSWSPCLYIHLYDEGPIEHEPEEWADIVRRFGSVPAVGLIAFVSGRHSGDEEVIEFVTGLLSRFGGAAMDSYTRHLWSLDELRGTYRVQGHPFFDYNGWFAEGERNSKWGPAADSGTV